MTYYRPDIDGLHLPVIPANAGIQRLVSGCFAKVLDTGFRRYDESSGSDLDVGDYVARSGGYTFKADDDRAYVVRANGQVEPANSGWWIFRHTSADVKPGDTIVVPLDVERMRPLTLWTSVTQIIYQLAVTLAVLNNVGAI